MWVVLVDMRDLNGKVVPMLSSDGYTMRIFSTFQDAELAVMESRAASNFPIRYVNMDE